jgi:hypothetical protein
MRITSERIACSDTDTKQSTDVMYFRSDLEFDRCMAISENCDTLGVDYWAARGDVVHSWDSHPPRPASTSGGRFSITAKKAADDACYRLSDLSLLDLGMLDMKETNIGRVPYAKWCHSANINFSPDEGSQPNDRSIRPLRANECACAIDGRASDCLPGISSAPVPVLVGGHA